MFRSQSKFDNEAPMSRRGVWVGLVSTVVLAMVAVLASTVGVLSSQSTTPTTLTFGSATYSVAEGEQLTVNLTSASSEGYDLVLGITPTADFNFAQDITSLELTLDGTSSPITGFPQTVSIESGTTMITLEFMVANDLYIEPNDSFTLSATPSGGTPATTVITLTDPMAVTVGLSVDGATTIPEGQTRDIDITLSRQLIEFDGLADSNPASSYKLWTDTTGSNFEDISTTSGASLYTGGEHNREFRVTLTDGFEFEFFDQTYQQISISANGFLRFGGVDRGATNTRAYEDDFSDQRFRSGVSIALIAYDAIPNDQPVAAAFWDDLDLRQG